MHPAVGGWALCLGIVRADGAVRRIALGGRAAGAADAARSVAEVIHRLGHKLDMRYDQGWLLDREPVEHVLIALSAQGVHPAVIAPIPLEPSDALVS